MGIVKKELFIVRHAKSSWDIENISDIDRPLSLRGIRNAYEMARRLKIERNVPEVFISSPANRALHTAAIFVTVFELQYEKLRIDTRLYGHCMPDMVDILASQPADIRKIMIFGHNPDLTEFARLFAKKPIFDLPTCGLVQFTFNCKNWSEIGKESLTSEFMDFPKKE
jgi:phosphohistidine phosphatase